MSDKDYDLMEFNRIWEQGTPQEGDCEEKVHLLTLARNRADYFSAGDIVADMIGKYSAKDTVDVLNRAGIRFEDGLILAIIAVRIPEDHPVRKLDLPLEAVHWVAIHDDPICTELAYYIRYQLDKGMNLEEIERSYQQIVREVMDTQRDLKEPLNAEYGDDLEEEYLKEMVRQLELAVRMNDHFLAGDLLQALDTQFGTTTMCKVVKALKLDWAHASTLVTIARTYPKESPIRNLGLPFRLLTLLLQVPWSLQISTANGLRVMLDSGMTPEQIIQQFWLG